MNAWRACVRLWAFGSAGWLGYWIWNTTQCTYAVQGMLLCPSLSGEGVSPIAWWRLGLMMLGPTLGTGVAGWLLYRWTLSEEKRDSGSQ